MRPTLPAIGTRSDGSGTRPLLLQYLESEEIGGHRHLNETLHGVRATRAPRTTHAADERPHGREFALDIDQDLAIDSVRDAADHAVAMGCLRDTRAVVHALDAAVGETLPVNERVLHG